MTKLYWAIQDCRLCRGRDLVTVLDLGVQALAGTFPKSRDEVVPAGPLRLVRCGGCGLLQLGHNYEFTKLYGDGYGYRSGLNRSMVDHLHDEVKLIQNYISLQAGDLVIDIGSNDGTLLAGYDVTGLKRLGIDPTGAKFQKYYAEGIDLIPERFSVDIIKQQFGIQKARVITTFAMFYDVERPISFARGIFDLLTPDGIWVTEQAYFPALVAKQAYDSICHEHLEYYDMRQMRWIAASLALKIIDVHFNAVNGGSFAVTMARKDAPYRDLSGTVVDHLVDDEAKVGWEDNQTFDRLRAAILAHKQQLLSQLTDLKARGKLVLGLGASTKGNVLLQYCGIDEDLLPAISEVNEDKFGSFTPNGIPIISEVEANAMNPDYYLVLPWHFRESIVEREQDFLIRGGGLIFPLPKLETVRWPDAR